LILAPIFHLLRKIWPGQPVFFMAVGFPVVFIIILWAVITKQLASIPGWVKFPITIWIILQSFFLVLSLQHGVKLFSISFFVQIVPLFLPWLAYQSIISGSQLRELCSFYSLLAVFLLPFAIFTIIFGDTSLPPFLRAIDTMVERGLNYRAGLQAFSGIFSTQAGMSNTMMGTIYLIAFTIAYRQQKGASIYKEFFSLLSAVVLLYSSTRRGALFLSLPALLFLFLRIKSFRLKMFSFVGLFILGALVIVLDKYSYSVQVDSRTAFVVTGDLWLRINHIFLRLWGNALHLTPWGTCLGAGSQAGMVVGIFPPDLEVGAAVVTHETGLIGVITLMICIAYLIRKEWQIASKMILWKQPVQLLVIFQLAYFIQWFCKERLAMGNFNFSYLLFWSVPGIIAGLAYQEKRL
jgi:hypothetical protein